MSEKQKFTDYLLDKYAGDFKAATTHPFLQAAGEGTIASEPLREWLKQDYLYAYVGYIKFASALLSKIHLSPTSSSLSPSNVSRSVEVLAFSLANVKRETDFFLATASQYKLGVFDGYNARQDPLLGEYNEITRAYVDFLHAIGGLGSIEEGLTLLWGMEKAYYEAWSFAKSHTFPSENLTETQKALEQFIDNWTNSEFKQFVDGCAEILDGSNVQLGSDLAQRCEDVFKRTLWLEQRFWPSV
ncbi:uncharacterized protein I303_102549 [Kwoniella dejecticola CBS 10117]|uniref:Thiaminase-2/PQQC domain-containing protein n=1 Tax=Kwoniella dejecticola CBS 10117 TaxID=1296121 RepID=A0A1A6A917_9TREE|nr:uncharacterized protein I303_02563 [Kwoniella dejecticola CBS 10117]OBR86555.1 hypothetical protein I303_02563 [Kwoniella dejecticola CBS 10117]